MNRGPDYLAHIQEAAELACGYVVGLDEAGFEADRRTQQAVIMNLIIIGEAATKLLQEHPDFCAQHATIPWQAMKGMRNRMAHGYFDINLAVVWSTVRDALPVLSRQVTNIRRQDMA